MKILGEDWERVSEILSICVSEPLCSHFIKDWEAGLMSGSQQEVVFALLQPALESSESEDQ